MRYQSFYPFSNQQPQSRPQPQAPMTQGPPPGQFGMPFPQAMQGNPGGPQGIPSQGMQGGGANNPQQQAGAQGTGPSRADQYMQTANRFFNTAQQFAPLVQQFAPLVQNLPAMWRLYKGVQSMPDVPVANSAAQPGNASAPNSAPPETVNQPSTPRIFQPPF